MRRLFRLLAILAVATAACERDPAPTEPDPPANEAIRTIGGARPATMIRPLDYAAGTPLPIVIALHGFTSNAADTDRYFGLSRRIDTDDIALILPNGTRNPDGLSFWNATDFCCDGYGSGVDDVGYLNSLVEEAGQHIVPDGVYLVGLSNGAFMSHRMACESMPGLRAIASVAGTTFDDPEVCEGAGPLSVLHIHGTADEVIRYGGGSGLGGTRYPGARETVERWAARAGCDLDASESLSRLDLDRFLEGAETTRRRYGEGCADGIRVELWTIQAGPHVPAFDPDDIGRRLIAWFLE
ncbi:MAG: hypothetical protein F4X15_16930 [Gemmatimonadetes bacterium]|nr:hypothetical protein [Gemmatimonadota bacterium]